MNDKELDSLREHYPSRRELDDIDMILLGPAANDNRQTLHDWQRSHIKALTRRGAIDELDKLKPRIGMLRQWLNEDRISKPDRMVTNEQIEHWLGLSQLTDKEN